MEQDSLSSLNTFSGGIDQDTHPTKYDPSKYLELWNGHVVTHENGSNGVIENETGNSLLFKIPSTKPIYNVGFLHNNIYQYLLDTGTYTLTIAITNQSGTDTHSYSGFATTANTDTLYSLLIASHASGGLADWISAGNIKIIQRGSRIVIISMDVDIVITQTVDIISSTSPVTLSPIVPSLSDLNIIGFSSMREELIIFTEKSGYGQIWKCGFDNDNEFIQNINTTTNELNPYYHLFYNNNLNFSVDKRILDTVPRYENIYFGKVWFTDNENNLRAINLNNAECISLNPDELETIPYVKQSDPLIVDSNTGGRLKSGSIQYVAQLYNTYGSKSTVSSPGKLFHLTKFDDANINSGYDNDSINYIGTSNQLSSNKTIELSFTVDNNYDVCRLIAIQYDALNSTPEVRIVEEKNIPNSGDVSFTDDGNKSIGILTTQELSDLNGILFSCKNILEQDNLLMASNITETSFDVDFDARCARYNGSNATYITDFNNSTEDDDVNPYNDFNVSVYGLSANRYIYQKDANGTGAFPTIIGGTGIDEFSLGVPNISYQFKLLELDGDLGDSMRVAQLGIVQNPDKRLFPDDLDADNKNLISSGIEVNNSFWSYKSPYVSGLFRGYQRDEIYRFGIVFFDKRGRKSFVKWIGDIRMPNMSDVDDNAPFGFNIARYDDSATYNKSKIYALYPEFEVNLPQSIISQISGFSIVRVKREGKDRTILSQGLLSRTTEYDGLGPRDINIDCDFGVPIGNFSSVATDSPGYDPAYTFFSPECYFNKNISYTLNDEFKIEGVFEADGTASYQNKYDLFGTEVISNQIKKYYQQLNIDLDAFYSANTMDGIIEQTKTGVFSMDYGLNGKFLNHLSALFPTVNNGSYDDNFYIANYRRDQSNRYGGNSLNSRLVSEYISCCSFVSVESMTNNTTYLTKNIGVMGGDTFVSFFDCLKLNYNAYHAAIYFPIESSINLELRHDPCASKLYAISTIRDPESVAYIGNAVGPHILYGKTITFETGDLYAYNSTYSQETTIETFFPKPINFKDILVRDTEIRNSQKRLSGETIDNWTSWFVNDFSDANPQFGAIHDMKKVGQSIYFLQDDAIGIIPVNERAMISDSTGGNLVIGDGATLGKISYATTSNGTKHKRSVILADRMYFYDCKRTKYLSFGGGTNLISDIKGLHSFFETYFSNGYIYGSNGIDGDNCLNETSGVSSIYDKKNNRIIITIMGGNNSSQKTIIFNLLTNTFCQFYDSISGLYHSHANKILSVNTHGDLDSCYIHDTGNKGEFYGITYPTKIKFIVNESPTTTKQFNNIEYNSNLLNPNGVEIADETISTIRFTNEYQDTGIVTLVPDDNIKRRFRSWRMWIPRNWDFTSSTETDERMRDKYIAIEMTFTNQGNIRFWLYDVITKFIPSIF